MGLLDRLREGLGMQRPAQVTAELSADDQAIARYRYLLRTAPPETVEQAHAEAFAQLTPEQRRRVLQELSANMSQGERMAAGRAGDDPRVLAQLATRAEVRQPGTMERVFGGIGGFGSPGMGGLIAGSFLSSMAGTVLGSMIAQQFFAPHAGGSPLFGGGDPASSTAGVQPDDRTAGLIHDPFARDADPDRVFNDSGRYDDSGSSLDDSGGFDDGGGDFGDGGTFDA
jgi:hypothetical protein